MKELISDGSKSALSSQFQEADVRLGNGSLVVMQGMSELPQFRLMTDIRPYTGILEGKL